MVGSRDTVTVSKFFKRFAPLDRVSTSVGSTNPFVSPTHIVRPRTLTLSSLSLGFLVLIPVQKHVTTYTEGRPGLLPYVFSLPTRVPVVVL